MSDKPNLKTYVLQKLNKLETHDRKQCFVKYQENIGKFVQDIADNPPFGNRSCYLFIIHKRSLGADERVSLVHKGEYAKIEDTPVAFMDMQCRLGKPEMSPNTTLLKIYPGKDHVKVIWSLPEQEVWKQFGKGMLFEDKTTCDSIHNYLKNKKKMEELEHDDPQTGAEFKALMQPYLKDSTRIEKLVRRIPIYGARETFVPIV